MDQYGTCGPEDAKELAAQLLRGETIVFPYSDNKVDCMILLMSGGFKKIGQMPFGGNPNDRVYVGVYGFGCNHFGPGEVHWNYFGEKLNLHDSSAEMLARLWKAMWVE